MPTLAGMRCLKCGGSMFWHEVILDNLEQDAAYECINCGAGAERPVAPDKSVPLRDRVGVGRGGGRKTR